MYAGVVCCTDWLYGCLICACGVFCMCVYSDTLTIEPNVEGHEEEEQCEYLQEEDQGQVANHGKPPSCSCPLSYCFFNMHVLPIYVKCVFLQNVYLLRA